MLAALWGMEEEVPWLCDAGQRRQLRGQSISRDQAGTEMISNRRSGRQKYRGRRRVLSFPQHIRRWTKPPTWIEGKGDPDRQENLGTTG